MTARERARFLVPGLLAGETRLEDLAPDVAAGLLEELAPLVSGLAARAVRSPAPVQTCAEVPGERLLTPQEAAARLGVAVTWIYRHADQLGARRLSRKVLRFPESGLARYPAGKRG